VKQTIKFGIESIFLIGVPCGLYFILPNSEFWLVLYSGIVVLGHLACERVWNFKTNRQKSEIKMLQSMVEHFSGKPLEAILAQLTEEKESTDGQDRQG
jgi:hypothetical protein